MVLAGCSPIGDGRARQSSAPSAFFAVAALGPQPRQSLCAANGDENGFSRQPRPAWTGNRLRTGSCLKAATAEDAKGAEALWVLACCSPIGMDEPKELSALSVLCRCRLRTAAATKLVRANGDRKPFLATATACLDRQQAGYGQLSQGGHRRRRKGRGGSLVLACCSPIGWTTQKLSALSVLCGCRLRTAARQSWCARIDCSGTASALCAVLPITAVAGR